MRKIYQALTRIVAPIKIVKSFNRFQKELLADKLLDLGNYIFVGMFIGQFTNDMIFKKDLAVIGLLGMLLCYYLAHCITNSKYAKFSK